MEGLSVILANKQLKPTKAKKTMPWQDEAILACKRLSDASKPQNLSSVFRAYKLDCGAARIALNDTFELGHSSVKYFFKVFSEIRKRYGSIGEDTHNTTRLR